MEINELLSVKYRVAFYFHSLILGQESSEFASVPSGLCIGRTGLAVAGHRLAVWWPHPEL